MPHYPKKSKSFSTQWTSHVQCKAVVHKSDCSGASLNIFEQIILEWIYNTLEMKMDWFNFLHRILMRPAPLHHLGILFLKTNLNIHFQVSDCGPSDFNLNGNTVDLVNEPSVPADSTEFHPFINGICINYIILQC